MIFQSKAVFDWLFFYINIGGILRKIRIHKDTKQAKMSIADHFRFDAFQFILDLEEQVVELGEYLDYFEKHKMAKHNRLPAFALEILASSDKCNTCVVCLEVFDAKKTTDIFQPACCHLLHIECRKPLIQCPTCRRKF